MNAGSGGGDAARGDRIRNINAMRSSARARVSTLKWKSAIICASSRVVHRLCIHIYIYIYVFMYVFIGCFFVSTIFVSAFLGVNAAFEMHEYALLIRVLGHEYVVIRKDDDNTYIYIYIYTHPQASTRRAPPLVHLRSAPGAESICIL